MTALITYLVTNLAEYKTNFQSEEEDLKTGVKKKERSFLTWSNYTVTIFTLFQDTYLIELRVNALISGQIHKRNLM